MLEPITRPAAPQSRAGTLVRAWVLLELCLLAACGGGSTDDEMPIQGADFVFHASHWPASERFVVRIADAQVREAALAELTLPMNERKLFPNGRLVAGSGGHNVGWSWHLRDVQLSAVAIELCDGTPSMVEADLENWLLRVQRFCPWSARVVAAL